MPNVEDRETGCTCNKAGNTERTLKKKMWDLHETANKRGFVSLALHVDDHSQLIMLNAKM